jgi:hypothetical protein
MWKKSSVLATFSLTVALLLSASTTLRVGGIPIVINVTSQILESDNLGNIYAVSGNTIRMYNLAGVMTAEFTMKQYDRFNAIDPSDPFKILAFNRITGETIRLDNKLVPQTKPYPLYNLGISNPGLVANSWDGGLWVYDHARHELIRINQHGTTDLRSGNLAMTIPENEPIAMIREHNFTLYMSVPNYGVCMFDRYANLIRFLPEKNIFSFQILNDKIVFLRNNELHVLNTKTQTTSTYPIPDNNTPLDAKIEGKKLLVRYEHKIAIYPFNHAI